MVKANNPIRDCAVCFYRMGFGIKASAKRFGIGHVTVKRGAARAGVYEPEKREGLSSKRMKAKADRANPNRRIKTDWRIWPDLQAFKRGDALTHWGDHPEVNRWMSLKRYYKNHDESLEIGRRNAKERWEKKKNDHEWRQARNAAAKKWRLAHPDRKRASDRRWIKNNPEAARELRLFNARKPKNKVARNLRKRLRDFIKNNERALSTTELVGCSRDHLITHIERHFKRGMRWDNYGKWHIDHTVPCSSFNLLDQEQQKLCFHYSNLKPMWAKENISKGGRIITCQPELTLALPA